MAKLADPSRLDKLSWESYGFPSLSLIQKGFTMITIGLVVLEEAVFYSLGFMKCLREPKMKIQLKFPRRVARNVGLWWLNWLIYQMFSE